MPAMDKLGLIPVKVSLKAHLRIFQWKWKVVAFFYSSAIYWGLSSEVSIPMELTSNKASSWDARRNRQGNVKRGQRKWQGRRHHSRGAGGSACGKRWWQAIAVEPIVIPKIVAAGAIGWPEGCRKDINNICCTQGNTSHLSKRLCSGELLCIGCLNC